jgi:hypothetical protein
MVALRFHVVLSLCSALFSLARALPVALHVVMICKLIAEVGYVVDSSGGLLSSCVELNRVGTS